MDYITSTELGDWLLTGGGAGVVGGFEGKCRV